MQPDLAQIGMTLIVFGVVAIVACRGWTKNPDDYVTRTLSFIGSAASHLFSNKGKRA